MASANRITVKVVKETTPGTTPPTPKMRSARIVQESIQFSPEFVESNEIRPDRMTADPAKTVTMAGGSFSGEFTYPVPESFLSTVLESVALNPFAMTAERDNAGVLDDKIRNVAVGTQAVTTLTGPAFVTNDIVAFSGFGLAANNGVFVCTTGSATAPVFLGAGLVTEAAIPAYARMKVVGREFAPNDISATADGLTSSAFDFTTLFTVGMYIRIGGVAAGNRFVTAANNTLVRVAALSTNAMTLDGRPTNWAADPGAGRTMHIFIPDTLRNGVTPVSMTLEKGYLDQVTPSYQVTIGQQVTTFELSIETKREVTWSATLMGMGGDTSTVSLDPAPLLATTDQILAANANVGRFIEGGSVISSLNGAKSFSLKIDNNLRQLVYADSSTPNSIESGENTVTGKVSTYFGSLALLDKFKHGTPTSFSASIVKNNKAVVFTVPRMTYMSGGSPSATGKNTDVMNDLDFKASFDPTTNSHFMVSRFEYIPG